MKHCNKCDRDLDESLFGKCKRLKDGLNNYCKECTSEYESKRRLANGTHKFIRYKVKVTDNKRECPNCHSMQPFFHYQDNKRGWCRQCRSDCESKRRIAKGIKPRVKRKHEGDLHECMGCKEMLTKDKFTPNKRNKSHGIQSMCKECKKKESYDIDPAKSRAYSKKSRDKNLERSRLLGRMKQRRRLGKTTHDVPKHLKDPVLNYTHCYYCGEYIKYKGKFDKDRNIRPNFRTIDHKIPVDRGGDNSPENLVMACNCCNSSKRNKTSKEYIKWRIKNEKQVARQWKLSVTV